MKFVWFAPVLGVLSGCFLFESNRQGASSGQTAPALQASTIEGSQIDINLWSRSLQSVAPGSISEDELWALSNCNCAPIFTEKYERSLALSRGALPELLVPTIREEIRNNDQIKLLSSLKEDYSAIARKLFADDNAIADQIRSAIVKKIRTATGWGSGLEREKFRFSPFPAVGNLAAAQSNWTQFFSISNQAMRWNFIFSHDSLWTGEAPVAMQDSSYQILNVMLALSEWEYLFGLSRAESGAPYGGLTLATVNPASSGLKEFDPRKPYDIPRFVSGKYAVSFQSGIDAVDTALNAREIWSNMFEGLWLDEQARIWTSAAKMFNRTRPKNRGYTASLFSPSTGILPDETHFLALIVLPSFQELLGKVFIDQEKRMIRTFIPQNSDIAALPPESANTPRLVAMSRALVAMSLWYQELQMLGDVNLSRDLKESLSSAPQTIKRGMQFVVQTLLAEYGKTAQAGSDSMRLVVAENSGPLTASQAAEAISALAFAEKVALSSDFLKRKVGRLSDWFVTEYLQRARVDSSQILTMSDAFWSMTLLNLLEGGATRVYELPWLQPSVASLRTLIQNWDKQL